MSSLKSVDKAMYEALKQVNQEMYYNYGVAYVDVAEDIHGGFAHFKNAYDSGRVHSVPEYVEAVASGVGFVARSDWDGPGDVGARNIRMSALALYARENGYRLGNDGLYYRQDEDGVSRMSVTSNEGKWGFHSSYAEGATLSETSNGLVSFNGDGEFIASGQALDIGDANDRCQQAILERTHANSMTL